jgi:hypothetical protein
MTQSVRWNLQGDYFENCNCDFVCPCLFSPGGPLTALPTEGYCDVGLAFHIDRGSYGDVSLDNLNVVATAHADGAMGGGNWKMAVYFDSSANDRQQEALQAIFSGTAGGPMAILAPLVGEIVGTRSVAITFEKDGRRRSVRIPYIMHMEVAGIPAMAPDSVVTVASGHPVAPERLALAVGQAGSTYSDPDFGLRFDNSGKNGHYAEISWANN